MGPTSGPASSSAPGSCRSRSRWSARVLLVRAAPRSPSGRRGRCRRRRAVLRGPSLRLFGVDVPLPTSSSTTGAGLPRRSALPCASSSSSWSASPRSRATPSAHDRTLAARAPRRGRGRLPRRVHLATARARGWCPRGSAATASESSAGSRAAARGRRRRDPRLVPRATSSATWRRRHMVASTIHWHPILNGYTVPPPNRRSSLARPRLPKPTRSRRWSTASTSAGSSSTAANLVSWRCRAGRRSRHTGLSLAAASAPTRSTAVTTTPQHDWRPEIVPRIVHPGRRRSRTRRPRRSRRSAGGAASSTSRRRAS